ncbi:uncharacterized protein LOC106160070 [Lingula anatina]|uniref:Uncharacterized protein LOC106160070 n=1 Tax=Lingula anatina TaxID=7574 RepID=A0A2R2MNL4_LINAN|nr:uncharacterized protein LOC106160070 [Lingula anatina]|eukprot:XP_023931806.1 uncharacterized protein LOC106160070 [Lingula anatina]
MADETRIYDHSRQWDSAFGSCNPCLSPVLDDTPLFADPRRRLEFETPCNTNPFITVNTNPFLDDDHFINPNLFVNQEAGRTIGWERVPSTLRAKPEYVSEQFPNPFYPMPTSMQTRVKEKAGPSIKLGTFDGKSSWDDYKAQFDICAMVYQWSNEEKTGHLATNLRGDAAQVLGDLPPEHRFNYDLLTTALERRFSPKNRTEFYRVQARMRKRSPKETLSELAQAIRRLVSLGWTNETAEVKDTFMREYFLDALDDTRLRLDVMRYRPRTIDDCESLAIELEACQDAETARGRRLNLVRSAAAITPSDESHPTGKVLDDVTRSLEKISSKVDLLEAEMMRTKQVPPPSRTVQCFKCGRRGHFARECQVLNVKPVTPPRRNVQCFNCGGFGHVARNCVPVKVGPPPAPRRAEAVSANQLN